MHRAGSALVVHRGADLGGSCIKCGNPNAPHRRHVNLSNIPPPVYLTLLLSPFVFVLIAVLTRRRSDHWINLCDRCNVEWDRSNVASAASVAAIFGSIVGGTIAAVSGSAATALALMMGGPAFGVASLLVAGRKRLTARRVDETHAHLDGVSPNYVPHALPPAPGSGEPYRY